MDAMSMVHEADSTDAVLSVLSLVSRSRATAEAFELEAILDAHDRLWAEADTPEKNHFLLQAERSMIPMQLGRALGLSEAQVITRLSWGRRLRDEAKVTGVAFALGRIDASRARVISHAIEKLTRPQSKAQLDRRAADYAETHTVAELRRWLRQLVERLEPDEALDRAEAAKAERHVSIVHVDEGMSWLTAYLPAPVAAAIASRLHQAARTVPDGNADDERTTTQREADLVGQWLLDGQSTGAGHPRIGADIAVSVPVTVLAGVTEGFAEAADASWSAPAAWVTDVLDSRSTFWHRMIVNPVTDDVLAHEYHGRYAPDILDKALAFRDQVCRAPGCSRSASRCDSDHITPWPRGKTMGTNLWMLCRLHHVAKGHGVLTWAVNGKPTARPTPPVFEYATAA